jgi:hypothetical protein
VLASALVLVSSACGGDGEQSTTEPERSAGRFASTPSAPASATSFESKRHGYSVELPPTWRVAEFGGTWTALGQFTPGAEIPGEDVASSTEARGFLVVNSMTVPDGMSRAQWLARLLRVTRSGLAPGCRETLGKDVLGGEPASLLEHRCQDTHLVGRTLTHGDRGFYFTIGFPADDPAARAALEQIVASVHFSR